MTSMDIIREIALFIALAGSFVLISRELIELMDWVVMRETFWAVLKWLGFGIFVLSVLVVLFMS